MGVVAFRELEVGMAYAGLLGVGSCSGGSGTFVPLLLKFVGPVASLRSRSSFHL